MKPMESGHNADTAPLPYLLFSAGNNICGINCKCVQGIEMLGEIIDFANSDPSVRGGVFYQDNFIPLIDMRKILGLDSQIEAFIKAVSPEQRIKDHENWVSTLEKSVHDRVEFTLTDDPHLCAFGKWYYSFKTDNNVLKHQLSVIEAPHEAIHATAKEIKKLMSEGKQELALSKIEEMRATHYKATIRILSSLSEIVTKNLREVYVVINSGNGTKGIIVDSIVGIENLSLFDSLSNSKHIDSFGQREKDNSIVLVLNNSF